MRTNSITVGVVGANPERGWALNAHLPALRAMPDYRIAAVATTKRASAEQSAAMFGVPAAHDDWRTLIADPAVELVAVCVKVRFHREIALAAMAAGKAVFCEWPLGLDTAEAEEMAQAAAKAGVVNIVGLQGRAAPALCFVRDLVASGEIGDVVSTTLISALANWGAKLGPAEIYRTRIDGGATGLMVPGGHTLDSLAFVLGEFETLAAVVTTQHKRVEVIGTGEVVEATAPDQVLVTGRLASGAVASVHVKADMARPTGVAFQINGTRGDIVVATRPPVGTRPVGIQRAELTVSLSKDGKEFAEIAVPDEYSLVPGDVPAGPPFFTAQLYARHAARRAGRDVELPDFAAAVRRHKMLDAVQRASDTGEVQRLE